MSKKSFFLGFIVGAFVSILGLYLWSNVKDNDESIRYFEKPLSYENRSEATFHVFQVLGSAALAEEVSSGDIIVMDGPTVLLLGDEFYDNQTVCIRNPQRVGTYRYTTQSERLMTVPVIVCNK